MPANRFSKRRKSFPWSAKTIRSPSEPAVWFKPRPKPTSPPAFRAGSKAFIPILKWEPSFAKEMFSSLSTPPIPNRASWPAEAQVARAQAALAQEQARAKQADLNWRDLGYTEKPNDLVLRIPQLREASADLKTAEAQLAESRRNKVYTKIVAPFDGCVRTRTVGPGQSIGANASLAEIFATDYAVVRLPVSPKDLPFTPFQTQSTLEVTSAIIKDGLTEHHDDLEPVWEAQLIRSEGVIDETSRELFLIARIPDPYGLKTGSPPLRMGQPILAEIQGNLLEDVFVIPTRHPSQFFRDSSRRQ